MRVETLGAMLKGWFVGNFEPTVFRSADVEVAVKEYAAGVKEDRHYHKVATEITAIVRGRAIVNGRILNQGDVVVIDPGEHAEFETLEPTITVVVKIPGASSDKYVV